MIKKLIFSLVLCLSVTAAAWAELTGDLNNDYTVDIADLKLFAEQWLDGPGCAGHPDTCADLVGNNDGVNIADFAIVSEDWLKQTVPPIIINEIHYDPDVKTELIEYIELYNAGTIEVDISGWYFSDGITYEFPQGTTLPAGGYIVVTEDPNLAMTPTTLESKFGVSSDLIYKPFEGSLRNRGEKIELRNATGEEVDEVDYQLGFPWPTVGDSVPEEPPGNGHSIQLVNPGLDNDLGGSWRSAIPTPAAANSAVYAGNTPPHIRQVKHQPERPVSGEVVTITAKVTDPDGVASVTLHYQLVSPGSYIRITDPEYNTNWTTLTMHDDGTNGDEFAGDSIYTAQMTGDLQTNRRLVRYRITIEDTEANSVTVPYSDDPQPNFAYFVYDGVPPWSGANKPGDPGPSGDVVEYGTNVMRSLPVYHLISQESDVLKCQYNSYYRYTRFRGTMVYDGEVYDHIEYRIRGEYSTYVSGKNKWKFFFTRGHDFQGRNNYGDKYDRRRKVMNLVACATPWVETNRGMAGVDEALAFALYNKAGVPSPRTNFLQFRIIDDAVEANPSDQYEGDLWGLYLTLEYPDGRFLDEHALPDGNTYKIENGAGDKKNQGPTQSVDASDWDTFKSGYNSYPPVAWWEENLNLDRYFTFRSINRAVNNMDLREGWNVYFYHNPETNLWTVIPWDLDMLYVPTVHCWSGTVNVQNCLEHSKFEIGYQNRGRELQDLLLSSDQLGQLVNELATLVNPQSSSLTMADVDQFMWNYHPRASSGSTTRPNHRGMFYVNPATPCQWPHVTRTLISADHEGMMQWIKDFMLPGPGGGSSPHSYGADFLNSEVFDSDIPVKPTIIATCDPNFPINYLTFQTSAFDDPQGSGTFEAMKWRIAEVEPGSQAEFSDPCGDTELVPATDTWKYFKGDTQEPSDPCEAWRLVAFDDDSWLSGQTSIGYGDEDDNTILTDMWDNYTTVYLRHTFDVPQPEEIETLKLQLFVDDGCIIWINGVEVARCYVSDGFKAFDDTTEATHHEASGWEEIILPTPYDYLVDGVNVVAVHALNCRPGSSDFSIDVRLVAQWLGDGGDPGNTPLNYFNRPGKYEIDALWVSEEFTEFNNNITIPGSVVEEGNTYRVRCRMKDDTGRWGHWSDPNQFTVGEQISVPILEDLRITEVMYDPISGSDYEFVELKNIGTGTLDISNVSFTDGITFSFGGSNVTSIEPGEFVLVVRDQAEFESRYAGLTNIIAGEYTGKLNNAGEIVKLEDYQNGTIAQFEYNDSRGWPPAADGGGHSLVPLDTALADERIGSLNYCGNWRASAYINGSPGANDPSPIINVVLNEIMAHTDYSVPPHTSNDWIELYNTTGASITLTNWYLSDDIDDLTKWAIPGTVIPSLGLVSFDEVTGFHQDPLSEYGFGLNKSGEQVFLSHLPGTAADRVVNCVEFMGQENGVSLGRYPDGDTYWFHSPPTRDSSNAAANEDIVINEIMYHPLRDTDNDEYIELRNPTGQQIDLWNSVGTWRFDGGIDYSFPASTLIDPCDNLIVVGFDPAMETARLNLFMAAYGTGPLTVGEDIVGPYSGSLSNGGERIALERPQASDDPLYPEDISWVIVDEVIYFDQAPWPVEPDGDGSSLLRKTQTDSGNDVDNWEAATPSPGSD